MSGTGSRAAGTGGDRGTVLAGSGPAASLPGRYPAEMECVVEVLDGVVIRLRPIRADDGGRLAEFHGRLSPESVYRRYFFAHPVLAEGEIERFTHVDYTDRLALVALAGERIEAVGRYERLGGTGDAEVAFVVADEFQHHGIASLLLGRLAESALANGITSFVAETMAENRPMLAVFMHSGFHVTSQTRYGTVSLRFPIERGDLAVGTVRDGQEGRDGQGSR
jgi:GNAT superfamily N-acetyltransferase